MEVKDKIRQDQIELQKLLNKIMEDINIQEVQQTKAKAQFVPSLFLGVCGGVGGSLTSMGTLLCMGFQQLLI